LHFDLHKKNYQPVIKTNLWQTTNFVRSELITSHTCSAGRGKTRSSPCVNAVLLKIPAKKFSMLCLEFLQYGRAGGELFCLAFFCLLFFGNEKKVKEE
jgi:hypothetical protein